MQRTEQDGIIISCDFCGVDWDPHDETYANPMVEGHHGSVICLTCLRDALEQLAPREAGFDCCMCLQHREAGTEAWAHPAPQPGPGLNPHAVACRPCIRQAAGRFSKDPDVQWKWEH